MLKFFSGLLLFVALLYTELWANPPEEAVTVQASATVAVVNGEIITQQDYDEYLKARMEQTSVKQAPDKETIIEELINRQLVIQDALSRQIDKTPDFKEKLDSQKESLLAAMGMQDFLDKNPLSEETLKAEYDKRIKQVDLPKEYKVKHILVSDEEEAKAIISALDKAEPFAKLAQEKSIDSASVKNGGDLGWVMEQQVVSAFATEMVKLKKGEYTKSPVKSEFGWHVIALEDIRDAIPPSFESVRPNLEMMLQTQRMQGYVNELRKKAQVTTASEDKVVSPEPAPAAEGDTPATESTDEHTVP